MASNIFHKSRTKSNKDNNVNENKLSNLLPVDDIDLNAILNKNSVKSSLSNWLIQVWATKKIIIHIQCGSLQSQITKQM